MPDAKHPKKPSPAKPSSPPKAAAAFGNVEKEIASLDVSDLIPINLDIPQSVSIVLGVLPGLGPLRPQIVTALPKHPMHLFDRLEAYALAAWYAHLLSLPTASPENPVKPLLDEATPLRANLLGDADALARRGLISQEAVEAIRAGQGNVDLANDLVALSALFLASWPDVAEKTAATLEEVKRAGDLGPLLLAALGVRQHGPAPTRPEARDRRARAYTLLLRAYDSTRRAIAYLRWEDGDADEIAPSLYQGRGSRTGKSDHAPERKEDGAKPAPAEAAGAHALDGAKEAASSGASAKPEPSAPSGVSAKGEANAKGDASAKGEANAKGDASAKPDASAKGNASGSGDG